MSFTCQKFTLIVMLIWKGACIKRKTLSVDSKRRFKRSGTVVIAPLVISNNLENTFKSWNGIATRNILVKGRPFVSWKRWSQLHGTGKKNWGQSCYVIPDRYKLPTHADENTCLTSFWSLFDLFWLRVLHVDWLSFRFYIDYIITRRFFLVYSSVWTLLQTKTPLSHT